ncbi:MAG: hypothetical protein RIS76_815, partial [Verrucomicrobiota bacterium]
MSYVRLATSTLDFERWQTLRPERGSVGAGFEELHDQNALGLITHRVSHTDFGRDGDF